ncbi:MAG: flavin reductase family protein [Holophagales bacterium]|nr:flavin reductase family protein [Holophagales bacterium]
MDRDTYRSLIGQFATGVTVVTTNVDGRLHGMTANAVCSLSLEPLQLLVCVDRESNCYRQMQRAEAFGLSILACDQEEISNAFARTTAPAAVSLLGVAFRQGRLGEPLIENALAHLECRIAERIDGGDHISVIGDVGAGERLRDAEPLLFYGGRYARLSRR